MIKFVTHPYHLPLPNPTITVFAILLKTWSFFLNHPLPKKPLNTIGCKIILINRHANNSVNTMKLKSFKIIAIGSKVKRMKRGFRFKIDYLDTDLLLIS